MESQRAISASKRSDDSQKSPRLEPLRAFRALQRLLQNPNDTAEVFTIIDALSGPAQQRTLARFRADPAGRRLLGQRPDLLVALRDRAALERMPAGSLAHAYLAFLDSEGISADGLVQASQDGRTAQFADQSDLAYVMDRVRDTHDLWHTVTGYRGDVVGEAALLAFNVAQLHNPGVATIVVTALLRFRSAAAARLIGQAFLDGVRAAWMPPLHWEILLPLPVDEVRALLRIERVPAYAIDIAMS